MRLRVLGCALALALGGCALLPHKPAPAPSSLTEKQVTALLANYDTRLNAIAAWVKEGRLWAATVQEAELRNRLQAVLDPAQALAGTPTEAQEKAAHIVAEEAAKENLEPSKAAVEAARQVASQTPELRRLVEVAMKADRENLEAYLKKRDADWQAKLDKAQSYFWNLISGGAIGLGLLILAGGFVIRAMAAQIPVFGPKAAGAVSAFGATLLAGGVCLYAIGPYLYIVAITLGVAAVCALIAGVLFWANHLHAKDTSP